MNHTLFSARCVAAATTVALCLLITGCSADGAQPRVVALDVPAATGSLGPHLSAGDDGTVVMSWLQRTDNGASLQWSALENGTWTDAVPVASGDNWFINWADFPSVTPISNELWAAHWLVRKPGGAYAYDVAASLSSDAGQTWGEAFIVHDDDSPTEHGFVTLFPWQEQLGVLWLDGRNTNPAAHHEHDAGDMHTHHAGGMTVRSAFFDAGAAATERSELDALVCDCCQTDVAIADSGPVAVYRNRTDDEIRDIHIARYVDGSWTADVSVADDGWEIRGCPVNGPAIASTGSEVAVAWFTAAQDDLRIRLARSADSGATFAAAIDIDIDRPIGRVDVIQHDSGATLVSWIRETDEGNAALAVRVVERDGSMGEVQTIARLSSGRISGFPQMVASGDNAVFAWTDSEDGATLVRSASVPLVNLLRK